MNQSNMTTAPAPVPSADIAGLRERQGTRRSFLWHGFLLPGCITLLTSLWKSGKTTLVAVLLARLATGGNVAGLALRPGRAAVVSEEADEHWLNRDELLHFGDHIRFFNRPFRDRPTVAEWHALIDQLVDMHRQQPLALVVIDPLASFLPSRGENHACNMLDALLPLQRLTADGICVLVLHHPKKGESAEAQAARGSGALSGHVDIMIEMKWLSRLADGDRRRVLYAYSRHTETPRRVIIELNAAGTNYDVYSDCQIPEHDGGVAVLHGVLEDADGKLTRKQMLANWPQDFPKPDDATLWRWLEKARQEGQILRDGTGRRNFPYVYWLDGMEEVWASDPRHEPLLPRLDEGLTIRRKTLAEVHAERAARRASRRKPDVNDSASIAT